MVFKSSNPLATPFSAFSLTESRPPTVPSKSEPPPVVAPPPLKGKTVPATAELEGEEGITTTLVPGIEAILTSIPCLTTNELEAYLKGSIVEVVVNNELVEEENERGGGGIYGSDGRGLGFISIEIYFEEGCWRIASYLPTYNLLIGVSILGEFWYSSSYPSRGESLYMLQVYLLSPIKKGLESKTLIKFTNPSETIPEV